MANSSSHTPDIVILLYLCIGDRLVCPRSSSPVLAIYSPGTSVVRKVFKYGGRGNRLSQRGIVWTYRTGDAH